MPVGIWHLNKLAWSKVIHPTHLCTSHMLHCNLCTFFKCYRSKLPVTKCSIEKEYHNKVGPICLIVMSCWLSFHFHLSLKFFLSRSISVSQGTLTCQLDCLEKGIAHCTTRIRNLRQTLRNLAGWTDLQFSSLLQASGGKRFKWIKVIIAIRSQ